MIHIKKLLLLAFVLLSYCSYAQLNVAYWILKDTAHVYQAEDVATMFPDEFQSIPDANLNFGLSNDEYWIVTEITNTNDDLFIGKFVIDYPLLRKITYYEIAETGLLKQPPVISSHAYIFSIKVNSNSHKLYMLHVKGNTTPGIFPIKIDEPTNIMSDELTHTFLIGSFYGILLFLFTLLLVINLITKEGFFRALLLYITVSFLFFSIGDGFVSRLNIHRNTSLQFQLTLLLIPLMISTYEVFIRKYFKNLHVSFNNKNRTRVFHLTTAILILIIISGLLPYKGNFYLTSIYALVWLPVMAIPALSAKKLQQTAILTIVIAIAVLEIGFIIETLHKIGILENSFITLNALKISFVLHVSVFLLGAVAKFQKIKGELGTFSLHLSELVEEKTAEINQQNEELTVQTEQLGLQKEELESQKEELQTQKEVLEEQNIALERLNVAASNTENVIYIFNTKGHLLWFNDSFSSQLGMSFEKFHGENKTIDIREISSYEDISEVVQNVLENVKPVSYEANLQKNGETKWFQTTLTPVLESGELKYIVAIDSDITRLKIYEKEIITQQHDFEMQRNLAIEGRKEVENQQREITDSLNYAKRIQSAILPSTKNIARFFPESFILFMPRDIVSGDFYWFHRIEDKFISVVVDCTGHGVPGAFMSIIGTYLLNNIIIQNNETRPAEILKQLNRKLKISLKNSVIGSQTNDGMDVSLVAIDKSTNTLTFAGALRPLFLFQDGKFIEQKGDKTPITSAIAGNTMATFNEYTYSVSDGDVFYLFSDGIVDQFGGERNKKFLTKRLKQVLFDAQMYSMEEQKKILQKSINNWRGKNAQIDDILVLGVKL